MFFEDTCRGSRFGTNGEEYKIIKRRRLDIEKFLKTLSLGERLSCPLLRLLLPDTAPVRRRLAVKMCVQTVLL
nr:hypothetical protein CFP56_49395 [Quercus suber]